MKIKIMIFDEEKGYSIDITTWRNRLIRQERCNNLMELSNFLTDILNVNDWGLGSIVCWFINEYRHWYDKKRIPPPPIINERFEEWYADHSMKKFNRYFSKINVKRSQP